MSVTTNRIGGLSTTPAAYNKTNAVSPSKYSFSGNPNSPNLDKNPTLDVNLVNNLTSKARLQKEENLSRLTGENKAPSFSILA